jgi:hypothetical protein
VGGTAGPARTANAAAEAAAAALDPSPSAVAARRGVYERSRRLTHIVAVLMAAVVGAVTWWPLATHMYASMI